MLLGAVLALLGAVVRIARVLLRLLAGVALCAVVALVVGGVVALLTAQNPQLDAASSGLLAAGLSLPFAAWAAWERFGRDDRLAATDDAIVPRSAAVIAPPPPPPEPLPLPPPPEPAADRAVAQAWEAARRLAPEARPELSDRRAAAAAVLHRADAGTLDMAVIEAATAIRRHLPALVEQSAALAVGAPPAERRALAADMLVSIRDLTDAAVAMRNAERQQQREELAARRAHLARRAAGQA